MHLTPDGPRLEGSLHRPPSIQTARRELGSLIGTTAGLFVAATILGQSSLSPRGPWGRVASWTHGSPTIAALRVLRVLLQFGAGALLVWLAFLAVLCVPRRTKRSTVIARLPFGAIVRRAVLGTVVLSVVGSSGNAALASSRPAVVANDATGGQRWPDLTPSASSPTSAATATSSATAERMGTRAPSTGERGTMAATSSELKATVAPRLPPLSPATTVAVATVPRSTSLGRNDAGTDAIAVPRELVAGPAAIGFRTDTPRPSEQPVAQKRIVRAGESFWSIAEDEVLSNIDEATDADVADYWRRLIALNRAGLPDPKNPDLLWVDTVLALPSEALPASQT